MACLLVAMVNYNSAGYVRDCLRSIQDDVARIVVVDNASTSADRVALQHVAASDPRLTVVLSDVNLGFGGGVNLAVERLEPDDDDVIVILNPDTRVEPRALETLARALRSGEFDVVSPVIYTGTAEGPTLWYAGGHLDLRRGETIHVGMGEPVLTRSPGGSVSFVTGSDPSRRARIASSDSSIISRWRVGSMPIMNASEGSAPGPTPNIVRPRVRWSSSTMRSASISGWWYGSELTPVPSLMWRVRSAATPMNTSGLAMIS